MSAVARHHMGPDKALWRLQFYEHQICWTACKPLIYQWLTIAYITLYTRKTPGSVQLAHQTAGRNYVRDT